MKENKFRNKSYNFIKNPLIESNNFNLKSSLLDSNVIQGKELENEKLIEKNKLNSLNHQKRKHLIRNKSEQFFQQYDFGVPKFHEFSPRFSTKYYDKFLEKKINSPRKDKFSTKNRILNPYFDFNDNFIHKSNISSNFSTRYYNFNMGKTMNLEEIIKDNTDLNNISFKKFPNLNSKKSINLVDGSEYNQNRDYEFESFNHSNENHIKSNKNFTNQNYGENDKTDEKNQIAKANTDLNNQIISKSKNKNNNSNEKEKQNIIDTYVPLSIMINEEKDPISDYDFTERHKFKSTCSNLEKKTITSFNYSTIYNLKHNQNFKNTLRTTAAFTKNSKGSGFYRENENTNKNTKNRQNLNKTYLNPSFINFQTNSNYCCTNHKNFSNNNNIENYNFYQQNLINTSENNETNEYEDILIDKFNLKYLKSFNENSSIGNNQSIFKRSREETLHAEYYKNSDISLNKESNFSFVKKDLQKEMKKIHKLINKNPEKSVELYNKEYYKNNVISPSNNNKEEIENNKKSPNLTRKKGKFLKFFKPNKSHIFKYEKEFRNNYIRSTKKDDYLETERNFNSNYDVDKYSAALQLNTMIKFPNVILDAKNFSEIFSRNTKLLDKKTINKN